MRFQASFTKHVEMIIEADSLEEARKAASREMEPTEFDSRGDDWDWDIFEIPPGWERANKCPPDAFVKDGALFPWEEKE